MAEIQESVEKEKENEEIVEIAESVNENQPEKRTASPMAEE